MLNKTLNLFLCIVALLLSSCVKDVDIDFPEQQNKLVINSFFSTDSLLRVNVSQSKNILERLENVKITDANVGIYEGSILIETLAHAQNGDYISQIFKPQTGKNYTVKAFAPDFETAQATDKIPTPIAIDAITLDSIYDPYSQMYMCQLRVKLTDEADKDNYYHLIISSRHELNSGGREEPTKECVGFEDPVADVFFWNCNGFMFDDNIIQGKSYEFKIPLNYRAGFFGGNGLAKYYFIAELRSVSKSYFEYNRTYYLQKGAEFDPLSQPVQVFSNVENGFGIFAGYTSVKDSIELE